MQILIIDRISILRQIVPSAIGTSSCSPSALLSTKPPPMLMGASVVLCSSIQSGARRMRVRLDLLITTEPGGGTVPNLGLPANRTPSRARHPAFCPQTVKSGLAALRIVSENPRPSVMSYQLSLYAKS
jgi:hypothetical protein